MSASNIAYCPPRDPTPLVSGVMWHPTTRQAVHVHVPTRPNARLSLRCACLMVVYDVAMMSFSRPWSPVPPPPAWMPRDCSSAPWQGLTLVHFSAQPEPFLT